MHSVHPLRIPAFRRVWLAYLAVQSGHFLLVVAGSWLMLELTGSPLWVALMVAAPRLPLLLFGLFTGALADLVDRRVVMMSSHGLMAVAGLASAALHSAGLLEPVPLLCFGLLWGTGHAANLPASQALVSDLVPSRVVASAVTLNSAGTNVARSVGPAVGGLLVALSGPGLGFALAGVLALAMVVALWPLRQVRDRPADEFPSLAQGIVTGLRYIRFTPELRTLMLVAAGFAITGPVMQVVLPSLSRDHFGGDATMYGLLLAAMGTGAVVGALARGKAARRLRARMVPGALVAFGMAGVIAGVAPSPAMAAVVMFTQGILWVWVLSTLNSSAQLLAPAWVRGRVMSVYMLSFVGVQPLGSVMSGALASALGVPQAIVAVSICGCVLGLVATRLPIPDQRRIVTPEPQDSDGTEDGTEDATAEVSPGRVLVQNRWRVEDADTAAFMALMRRLRRVRLRTGASRWALYREASDPRHLAEIYALGSWKDYLQQQGRLDAEALRTIEETARFERVAARPASQLVRIDLSARRGRGRRAIDTASDGP